LAPSRNANRQTELQRLEMVALRRPTGANCCMNSKMDLPRIRRKVQRPNSSCCRRDGQMGRVHAGTDTRTKNSNRDKPFPTVSQVEGLFVEHWGLQKRLRTTLVNQDGKVERWARRQPMEPIIPECASSCCNVVMTMALKRLRHPDALRISNK
jgi:hypothetical protein